jgi:hypothetical protein
LTRGTICYYYDFVHVEPPADLVYVPSFPVL